MYLGSKVIKLFCSGCVCALQEPGFSKDDLTMMQNFEMNQNAAVLLPLPAETTTTKVVRAPWGKVPAKVSGEGDPPRGLPLRGDSAPRSSSREEERWLILSRGCQSSSCDKWFLILRTVVCCCWLMSRPLALVSGAFSCQMSGASLHQLHGKPECNPREAPVFWDSWRRNRCILILIWSVCIQLHPTIISKWYRHCWPNQDTW